jgi:hypothetical protein
MKRKKVEPILTDNSIVAIGIDSIKMAVGGFNVFGEYDYDGTVGTYQFDFNYGWE